MYELETVVNWKNVHQMNLYPFHTRWGELKLLALFALLLDYSEFRLELYLIYIK
jgi:hypothetical protein